MVLKKGSREGWPCERGNTFLKVDVPLCVRAPYLVYLFIFCLFFDFLGLWLRLDQIQRNFLFRGEKMEKRPHLVNWNTVCLDRKCGDFKVKNLASSTRPYFQSGVGDLHWKGMSYGMR